MKKRTNFHEKILKFCFLLLLGLGNATIFAQCEISEAEMFQKYWQYKENFNKHFIVYDRDPSGCVNDGIGFIAPTDGSLSCQFDKQGFGLPASALMIAPNGSGVPGFPSNPRFSDGEDLEQESLHDPDCGGDISWGNGSSGDPNHKFNWIDFGSETLTQLGWNFVTLATEYELLRRSSQLLEQKKVLEEIFLGIQAVRRLDMQAQCMISQMYDDRAKTGGHLVCDEPYRTRCHSNYDSDVPFDCNYVPDFSGYNGFLLEQMQVQI
jgi:hypothetical protein